MNFNDLWRLSWFLYMRTGGNMPLEKYCNQFALILRL